jgi:hypothetical protein
MLRPELDERTIIEPEPTPLRLLHRYLQPFTSPNALHSLVVYLPSEFFQQRSDPSIPVPAEPGRQSDDIGLQGFFIVLDSWSMALGGSWLIESTTSPSFRDFRVNLLNALNEHTATRRA